MTSWAAKRFWKDAAVAPVDGGFGVHLDGRPVKTPAKQLLVVPTSGLAEAIAAEWQAQSDIIRPDKMPFTRSANSALDKVAPQFGDVADLVAAYGATDLLCYRAQSPQELCLRQAKAWDPLLEWSAGLGAPLVVTSGVMPVDQPDASVAVLKAQVHAMTPFQLAAFHDLVAISGSLLLGLAVCKDHLTPDEAWSLSRIDEIWQAELWGHDEDAAEKEAIRKADFDLAGRFFRLCG